MLADRERQRRVVRWILNVASLVAFGLDVDTAHVAAAIVAGLKSLRVTFVAFGAGILTDAVSNGARDLPQILAYVKMHWIAWTVTNIVAPIWRGTAAYKSAATPSQTSPPLASVAGGVDVPPTTAA